MSGARAVVVLMRCEVWRRKQGIDQSVSVFTSRCWLDSPPTRSWRWWDVPSRVCSSLPWTGSVTSLSPPGRVQMGRCWCWTLTLWWAGARSSTVRTGTSSGTRHSRAVRRSMAERWDRLTSSEWRLSTAGLWRAWWEVPVHHDGECHLRLRDRLDEDGGGPVWAGRAPGTLSAGWRHTADWPAAWLWLPPLGGLSDLPAGRQAADRHQGEGRGQPVQERRGETGQPRLWQAGREGLLWPETDSHSSTGGHRAGADPH